MSQRWSNFLKIVGVPLRRRPTLRRLDAIPPASHDEWQRFAYYDVLFQLYGPLAGSPWEPYHCPTLFASIDRLGLHPRPTPIDPMVAAPRPEESWSWLQPGTMVLLELPGALAVQMGAMLQTEAGAQLISTFDHWPRTLSYNPKRDNAARRSAPVGAAPDKTPDKAAADSPGAGPSSSASTNPAATTTPDNASAAGSDQAAAATTTGSPQSSSRRGRSPSDPPVAVDSLDIIHSMVTLAHALHGRHADLSPDAPPVWMCDSRRLRTPAPDLGVFDNRYYIDDSILPSPQKLRRHGVHRVVYFGRSLESTPSPDIQPFLHECHQARLGIERVALQDASTWSRPQPMTPDEPQSTALPVVHKSNWGGFGQVAPLASQSGAFASAGGGG